MRFFSKLAAAAAFIGLAIGFGSVSARADSYAACGRPGFMPCGPFIGHHPGPPVFRGHPGYHHGSRIGFEFRFGNVRPDYDYYRPPYVYRQVRFCSNDMAIGKARAYGVRHIRAYAYNDHILIKGSKHGHRVQLAFARARGCPIIGY
jgi:hypothetical protein